MIDAQAYVLRRTGVIPELEDIQISEELSRGQVRLRVLYSGLCATQMEEIFVSSRNSKYMPHLFGHEGVGVIEAVGPGVETKKVGDTCVIHWRQSSVGLDAEPGHYFCRGQKINSGKVVTFSTRVVVPENRVTVLPPNFPEEKGALLGCSLSTGWGSVVNHGLSESPDVVLIAGLGAVGRAAALSVLSQSNIPVIVIEHRPLAEFNDLPKLTIHPSFEDLAASFHQEIHGARQLIIDTTGNTDLVENLFSWASLESKLVLVGMPRDGKSITISPQRLLDGLRVEGCNGGGINPSEDLSSISALSNSIYFPLFTSVVVRSAEDLIKAIDDSVDSGGKQVLAFGRSLRKGL